jgi:hypothetical protein
VNKVIRYIKELEDEKGKPMNKWAVFEETQKSNHPHAKFIDAKIIKTFVSPYHARNWMENDGKRTN